MRPAETILHADLDAFYASVEQLLDPSLRGRPIAVGGGVVLAASYEARLCGVKGGMPGRQARQLCPGLLFVGGHFSEYQRLSDEVMSVLHDITPVVERISIDEAFLDVSGAVHLFGLPATIAQTIRQRVRDDIGLPISIGVARTKHLAKIASQVAKPDGLAVVPADAERAFLDPLPVGLVWGIGPVTQRRLAALGISTIGQLAESPDQAVTALLGRALGTKVMALAANEDRRRVRSARRASSVGAQSALGRQEADPALVRATLAHLADRVAGRLRAKHRSGRTVNVRIRFADLRSITRAHTLVHPVSSTLTITEVAESLVRTALAQHPQEHTISLLGVSLSNLVDDDLVQLELPLDGAVRSDPLRPGSAAAGSRRAVEASVDAVRERFGRAAVGYGSVVLGDHSSVPDAFRELAEREL